MTKTTHHCPAKVPALAPADMPGPIAVLRTAARAEKRIAAALAEANVAYYLPLAPPRVSASRNRHRSPLLPGFLFIGGSQVNPEIYTPPIACEPPRDVTAERVARDTRLVTNILRTTQQARLRSELTWLAAAERPARRAAAEPEVLDLAFTPVRGQRVHFVAPSPFAGLDGIVTGGEADGATPAGPRRLVIELQMLNRYIAVELTPKTPWAQDLRPYI